jgi:hypothetical protein
VLQGRAIQKLHGNESLPVLLANVVNRANVGMVECGCSLSFALKTGEGLRVSGNVFRQEFQRDEAMQPRVLSLVHDTHSTATELLDDAIVRNDLSDH